MTEYADFAALDERACEQERWATYNARKAAWEADNPSAYPAEHESFCRALATELGL